MGEATVNGDMPHSATLEHVQKYPVVSDSIEAFRSNPYGKKSIDLTNQAYQTLVKPTFPYLEKPASIAAPYVAKADEIGDNLLNIVDEKVPIVKSETAEVRKSVVDLAHWPLKVAADQRDYVLGTYQKQYEQCGGNGVIAGVKALISGNLIITSDYLHWIGGLLQQKKAEVKETAKDVQKEGEKQVNGN